MLGFRRIAILAAGVVAAALPLAPGAAAAAPRVTEQQIAAMPPAAQAAYYAPLTAAATAIDGVGTSTRTDVYAGVAVDGPSHSVRLYLADPGQASTFLAAVHAGAPAADLGLVRVLPARYTRVQLEAARDRVAAARPVLAAAVVSLTVPVQGDVLLVGLARVGSAGDQTANLTALAGVAVRATRVDTPQPKSGTRLHDLSAYSAGARIALGYNNGPCTSGIPVRRSGFPYMVTAAHCFAVNEVVTHIDGRDPIGTVLDRDTMYDAELIQINSGQNVQPYEYDCAPGACTRLLKLSGTANSSVGQQVCQDGYTSGVVCSIVVDQTNVWFYASGRFGSTAALGDYGHRVDHSGACAVQGGDSGGLVFAINSDNTRQVRGIVSAGGGSCSYGGISSSSGYTMYWTEATRIYSDFGVSLAT